MSYEYPGVYVEEVSSGARPISGVGTSEAAFFGPLVCESPDPTFLTSWTAFEQAFAVTKSSHLTNAVFGFFQNGGRRLYVVPMAPDATSVTDADLKKIAAYDTISLVAAPGFTDSDSQVAILSDCEKRGDRFAVLDLDDAPLEPAQLAKFDGGPRPRTSSTGAGAVYTPWLNALDPIAQARAVCPPSGHICGLYAQTDATRGVWKAPANAPLRGALGLTRRFSDIDQEAMNPKGVNVIRIFPDGIRVWGARTLGDQDGPWRYIPVRRLSTMISQSIRIGTRWVVFEPNDLTLWKSLRRDIGAFLYGLWRDGALAGATPDQAFFVRCDSETTTQADIDLGRVIAVIGIAPVKPAEFVIIRIGQSAGAPPANKD